MRGLWSGYDSANDIITSWKYTFTPIIKDISIVNFKSKYSSQILRISDNELGKDYFNIDDLHFFTSKDKTAFCKVAKCKNKIVGFAMSIVLSHDELTKYLKISSKDLPKFITASDNVCVIKTVAVDENYKGIGIGHKLVKSLMKEATKNKINDFASVAWNNKEQVNIAGILESLDLKAYKAVSYTHLRAHET